MGRQRGGAAQPLYAVVIAKAPRSKSYIWDVIEELVEQANQPYPINPQKRPFVILRAVSLDVAEDAELRLLEAGADARTIHTVPYANVPQTNGLAVASLVLGIVWLGGLGSILALIFGYLGKWQVDRSFGTESGRGLAVAGIVLGWIGIAFWVLVGLLLIRS